MKNNDTWKFAHLYLSKLWKILGIISFIAVALLMLPLYGKNDDIIGFYGVFICIGEVIILIVSIIPAEIALRKNFDKDGNRIK